ncbi:hypothetical protein A2U01_0073443, partial [Trifolium medium]|nr:hypothetical protein [Trifolium medium]
MWWAALMSGDAANPSGDATSPIGSGNGLNMYFIPMAHGSIPMEGKNSNREGGGEDHDVQCQAAYYT